MNATREQKIKELETELRFRRRVYPGLVRRGKMSIEEASRRTRVMQEILDDYQREGDLFAIKEGV